MKRAGCSIIEWAFLVAALGLGLLLAVSLAGCARPLDVAIVSANSAREVLVEGKEVIEAECVPAYGAAGTPAQVARVDARCLPAMRSYEAVRSAWLVTIAAIGAAQAADGGDLADVQRAALDLGAALTKLAAAIRALGAP